VGLLFVCAFFSLPQRALASDKLLINEFYPSAHVGEKEWIELYNPSTSIINLINYTIEDGTNKPLALDKYQIDGGAFLVLEQGVDFTFGLNNGGDIIILKENGIAIDEVAYGDWDDGNKLDNAPCPKAGQSIGRTDLDNITGIASEDFHILIPTKGTKYEKIIYSSGIIISEILPHPENGTDNEFIELFNQSNTAVEITGWKLDDAEGGSSPYVIVEPTILEPNQYLAFGKILTKISLNDDGDCARLLDPEGGLKSIVSYEKASIGQSLALFSANYSWTLSITPNSVNVLVIPAINTVATTAIPELPVANDSQIAPIIKAKELEINSPTTIRGVVTVEPGLLSNQYGYLQDDTGGVQFYSYRKDFPPIKKGDEVEIDGVMATAYGEKRIKTDTLSDISVVSSNNIVAPKALDIGNIDSNDIGSLVKAEGIISVKNSDGFDLKDENDKVIRVVIRSFVSDQLPKTKKGQRVEVSGILSIYKNELRILPFEASGVIIVGADELPRTGNSLGIAFYFFIGLILTWIYTHIVNQIQLNLPKRFRKP